MVHLCEHDDRYWEKWESEKDGKPVEKQRPKRKGPGHHLKIILSEKGYKANSSGCGCNDKASKMNAWGVERCREKIDEIVGWLEESARKAGWLEKLVVTAPLVKDFARKKIYDLVNEAIDRAEAELKRSKFDGTFGNSKEAST